jgi:spermidine/putrescine-binding protein
MLIQQQMFAELAARGKTAQDAQPEDLAEGWRRGLNLIRMIGANARYFTDSASKVTVDVAQGNAAAGMCIDFYGRFESETVERNESSDRMKYVMPAGGSSISVDPISLLKGAPNRVIAERFIDFCLSVEGQLLWNTRVGKEGGPERYALRRLPIRRDMYAPEYLKNMSDPSALPYDNTQFVYRAEWTGPLFNTIRVLVKAMCIDPHGELQKAWAAINQAGGPEQCPQACAVFSALPPEAEYKAAHAGTAHRITDKLAEGELMCRWTIFFREQYRKAAELAGKRK